MSQIEAKKSFPTLLVENLKALNAKERDHLMRFAYLGDTGAYHETKCWLSDNITVELWEQLAGTQLYDQKPACVFAAMDYHLDWLYAALFLACSEKEEGIRVEVDKRCRAIPDCGESDPTLRPISGSQEDVDLLVVFEKGEKVVVLFIEAKGAASVDKKQLKRKLTRLGHILEESGARNCLECKFVLVGREPNIQRESEELLEEARGYSGEACDLLTSGLPPEETEKKHINRIPLKGFPAHVWRVERTVPEPPKPEKPKAFKEWKVVKR